MVAVRADVADAERGGRSDLLLDFQRVGFDGRRFQGRVDAAGNHFGAGISGCGRDGRKECFSPRGWCCRARFDRDGSSDCRAARSRCRSWRESPWSWIRGRPSQADARSGKEKWRYLWRRAEEPTRVGLHQPVCADNEIRRASVGLVPAVGEFTAEAEAKLERRQQLDGILDKEAPSKVRQSSGVTAPGA